MNWDPNINAERAVTGLRIKDWNLCAKINLAMALGLFGKNSFVEKDNYVNSSG